MSIWKQLYKAWEEKNCQKFENLWKQLTEEDKKSPYFSYYASLKAKLCPQQNKKGKIILKGKTIKCPSCGSPLTLSEYNKEQIRKLKNGEKQVIFICNYCGENFSYSKTPFKTIFTSYSVGDEITLKGKKYKLAGAVRYKGKYSEIGKGSGSLEYIEWLAYSKKGEIYYISESRAKDSSGTYHELEISKKVNFPFVIKDINNSYIETDKGKKTIDEIDEVKVISLIGELNKGYRVGEKVKLWKFNNYNLEEEKGTNYIERNLYENTNNINLNNKKNTPDNDLLPEVMFFISVFLTCPVLIVFAFIVIIWILPNFKNPYDRVIAYSLFFFIGIHLCISRGNYSGGGGDYSSWGGSSWGGGK